MMYFGHGVVAGLLGASNLFLYRMNDFRILNKRLFINLLLIMNKTMEMACNPCKRTIFKLKKRRYPKYE
jgi:hypothetical protein